MINIHVACQKELKKFPEAVREDLADALARLQEGQRLSFPLSRPMPTISKRAHEIRLRDQSGIFRIVYVLIDGGKIWLLAGFKKTTQKTPHRFIELSKKRLKDISYEKNIGC